MKRKLNRKSKMSIPTILSDVELAELNGESAKLLMFKTAVFSDLLIEFENP